MSRRGLSASALALAALFVAPPAGAAVATAEKEFCAPRVLVDFEAPLVKLPKVRELPRSGKLPFGPRRLRIAKLPVDPRGYSNVIRAGEGIGYRLWLGGALFGAKRIGWNIESRLIRVGVSGNGLRLVKRKRQRLGLLPVTVGGKPTRRGKVGFGSSPPPGLYRYDLLFTDAAGRLLGRYSEHYHVVPRAPDVRLVLFGSAFSVGDSVLARVENHGATWARFGAGAEFDRLDEGTWVRADFEALFGHPNVVPMILLSAPPGRSAGCRFNGFVVPTGMSPGHYRMVKQIGPEAVTAEFTVLP